MKSAKKTKEKTCKAAQVKKNKVERIKKLKARRDNAKLETIFDKLRTICEKEENVMPIIMEATKEGATVGEICGIYREIWGIWEPPLAI